MTKEPSTFWSEDQARVVRLKDLQSIGLSAGQIASAIGEGCTRNMVIGKVRRLKLPLLGRTSRGTIWQPDIQKKVRAVMKQPEPVEVAIAPVSLRIPFAKSGDRQCRFIAGDPVTDSSICGHETPIGKPYCGFHLSVTFQPASVVKRTTDAP